MSALKGRYFILSISLLASSLAFANRRSQNGSTIDHCYHWIKEEVDDSRFLTKKYQDARTNGGQFSFEFQRSDNIAGKGIYCAKTPAGSSSYGDRLVRIDLVDDVTLWNSVYRQCTKDGALSADACRKNVDIELYKTNDRDSKGEYDEWYVIRSPFAIKKWSANSDLLLQDLRVSMEDGDLPKDKYEDVVKETDTEISLLGHMTWYNSTARVDLEKVVSDSLIMQKTSKQALLKTLVEYKKQPKKEISAEKIAKVLKYALEDAFSFPQLTAMEIAEADAAYPELGLKKAALTTLALPQWKSINSPALVSLIDLWSLPTPESTAIKLWRHVLQTGLTSEVYFPSVLKDGSLAKRALLRLLEQAASAGSKGDNRYNIRSILNLASQGLDLENDTVLRHLKVILGRASLNYTLEELLNLNSFAGKVGSPANGRPKLQGYFAELIVARLAKSGEKDPVTLAETFAKRISNFSTDQVKLIARALGNLSLSDSKLKTQELLQKYQDAKISSVLLRPQDFYSKLIERALAERDRGDKTIDIYSTIAAVVAYDIRNRFYSKLKGEGLTDLLVETYEAIFKVVLRSKHYEYGFIALRQILRSNSVNERWFDNHIVTLSRAQSFGSSQDLDEQIEVLVRSADREIFDNLIALTGVRDKKVSAFARSLLSRIIANLKSEKYLKELGTTHFKKYIEERAVRHALESQLGHTYTPDYCYALLRLVNKQDWFIEKFSTEFQGVPETFEALRAGTCQGYW